MKRYCFDTSGLSNPVQQLPEDIYRSIWLRVTALIEAEHIAVTTEIYDEMVHIPGPVGACIVDNRRGMVMEVTAAGWDWQAYARHISDLQVRYEAFTSERQGDRKRTVGLNDMSIIALAKTLGLPVVSMETPLGISSEKRRKIPDICHEEQVEHIDFNEFLRREGIRST